MANNPKELRPELIDINDLLKYFSKIMDKVKVFQVGANDGKTNDPIYEYITKFEWEAILVEPQPDVFERELKKNYRGFKNVNLVNAAIGNSNLPFYRLSFSDKRWATGLSSFDRKSLEEHILSGYVDRMAQKNGDILPPNKEEYISTIEVKMASFENLLEKYSFDNLDMLVIDTEGYDLMVLKQFNFDKIKPNLVLFESKNLSDQDFIQAKNLLIHHGYSLFWQKGDTVAIRFKYPFIRKIISKIKAFLKKV